MKTYLESDRNRDALQLWVLILMLMKATLATDLTLLNDILYILEVSMRHRDASVRLMNMEVWGHLVAVFRQSCEWFFKKSVVQLLVRPVLVCLEEERSANILHTAFIAWSSAVSALVEDFNRFCAERAGSHEAVQASARKWKRWYDEALTKPLVAVLTRRELSGSEEHSAGETQQFIEFAATLWHVSAPHVIPSEASTAADMVAHPAAVAGVTSSSSQSDAVAFGQSLFGLALIMPDILGMIHRLVAHAERQRDAESQRVANLAESVWSGLCVRLHDSSAVTSPSSQKLRLRLVRISLEFAFAIPNGSVTPSGPVVNSSSQDEVKEADVGGRQQAIASSHGTLFGVHWQLRLLRQLLSGFDAAGEERHLFTHSKSKLSLKLAKCLERVKTQNPTGALVLAQWSSNQFSGECVDFASRSNVLQCIVAYVMSEWVFELDSLQDTQFQHQESLDTAESVIQIVCKCVGSASGAPASLSEWMQTAEDTIGCWKRILEASVRNHARIGSAEVFRACLTSDPLFASHEGESDQCENAETDHDTTTGIRSEPLEVVPVGAPAEAPASADTSMSSSCLLDDRYIASSRLTPKSPSISADEDLSTRPSSAQPLLSSELMRDGDEDGTDTTGLQSVRSEAPPSSTAQEPLQVRNPSQGVFPELVGSSEPISQLYRHFPLAFRPFFSYYKIKTIGDLSAMSAERVKTFGIKDPVSTVMRALKEFSGRNKRLRDIATSPFRQRTRSPAAITPTQTTPSPRRSPRRAGNIQKRQLASLILELPRHKRVKRTLLKLGNELTGGVADTPSADTSMAPKLAERVTFCLPVGEGETRIARPGEDSQDPNSSDAPSSAREISEEKLETISLKFLQHLRRSALYLDKLVAADDSLQSDASLQTSATTMSDRFMNFQEANHVIEAMSRQVQQITEAHATRYQQFLYSGKSGKSG